MSIKKQELFKILASNKYECYSFKELPNGDIELELNITNQSQDQSNRINELETKCEDLRISVKELLNLVEGMWKVFQDMTNCITITCKKNSKN